MLDMEIGIYNCVSARREHGLDATARARASNAGDAALHALRRRRRSCNSRALGRDVPRTQPRRDESTTRCRASCWRSVRCCWWRIRCLAVVPLLPRHADARRARKAPHPGRHGALDHPAPLISGHVSISTSAAARTSATAPSRPTFNSFGHCVQGCLSVLLLPAVELALPWASEVAHCLVFRRGTPPDL